MDINNLWSDYDLNSKKQNTRCLAINTILEGKYLVGPVLGQGGFGITYVGYDLNMEAKIAIKEYFPVELVSRDTTTMHGDRVLSLGGEKSVTYKTGLKKYVAEAQNVSQFSEIPGVVSVKDFFYANETAYIVMEYIDGISLKDYLKEKGGRLTEEETLKIMKPVLEALVQVHKSGIIHRDISPDNIMLTFEEGSGHGKIKSVKLIDFGAARMTAKNDQKSLTIILKHGYAPEEQYRTHGEQGPWTDVYALSAVLYRMLTGETPVPAMDRMFQDELKNFDKFNTKVSANTTAAIFKGLAVKKDDRIQNVQELIGALYEGAKVRAAAKKNKTPLIAGAGVTALAACALAVVLLGKGGGGNTVVNSEGGVMGQSITAETIQNAQVSSGTAETSEAGAMTFADQEEMIGEQVAFYHPQNSFSDWFHVLICKPNGEVVSRGWNDSGQCDVQDWDHIVSVKAGARHSLGLRSDGMVFAAGDNDYGQCDVEHWRDIVQISTGEWISFGVTADGKVQMTGQIYDDETDLTKVGEWTDIKRIANMRYRVIAGLKYDGTVVCEGIDPVEPIEGWQNVEEMFFVDSALVGLDADGTVRVAAMESTSNIEWITNIANFKIKQWNNDVRVTVDGKLLETYSENNSLDDDISLVSAGSSHGVFYYLEEDGTLIEHVENRGNAEPEDFINLESVSLIEYRDGQAAVGMYGKTRNGERLYCGPNEIFRDILWINESDDDAEDINIKKFLDQSYLTDAQTLHIPGEEMVLDGVLDVVSDTQSYWCLMEDGTVDHILLYETSQDYGDVSDWTDIVQICGDYWLCGLKKDGTVVFDSGYECGETDIVQICSSGIICLGLREDGTVANLEGFDPDNGSTMVSSWENITQIAMGQSHTVGLKEDGTVVAVGSNHCGQCDVEEWRDVVYIDAAVNRTIGMTKDGKLLIAGTVY